MDQCSTARHPTSRGTLSILSYIRSGRLSVETSPVDLQISADVVKHRRGRSRRPTGDQAIGRFTGCPNRRYVEGSARTGEGAAVLSGTSGWNGPSYAACTDRRRGTSSCSASWPRGVASSPSVRSDRRGRPPDECRKHPISSMFTQYLGESLELEWLTSPPRPLRPHPAHRGLPSQRPPHRRRIRSSG